MPGNLRASGFASAIVTSLFASGYCRAWSVRHMGSIPRASAWAGSAGASVAASVNPYLTSRGASSGASDARMISYAKGAGKSKEIVRKDAACSQAAGMDQEVVQDAAFRVVVGSAGHSSGTSSSSGAT